MEEKQSKNMESFDTLQKAKTLQIRNQHLQEEANDLNNQIKKLERQVKNQDTEIETLQKSVENLSSENNEIQEMMKQREVNRRKDLKKNQIDKSVYEDLKKELQSQKKKTETAEKERIEVQKKNIEHVQTIEDLRIQMHGYNKLKEEIENQADMNDGKKVILVVTHVILQKHKGSDSRLRLPTRKFR